MSNPAIRQQPNGNVDISVPDEQVDELANAADGDQPEPSVDPENLDHPEELMGE
jgi:hypothetical protein